MAKMSPNTTQPQSDAASVVQAIASTLAPNALALDVDEAAHHLRLLDPDTDTFIFASFDDDKERAKETDKIRKEVAEGVRPKSDLAGRVLPEQGPAHCMSIGRGWRSARCRALASSSPCR